MRVILDTHVMIWAIQGSPRLSNVARDIINDDNNDVYFSSVSLIEISTKRKTHPESMLFNAREARKLFVESGYEEPNLLLKRFTYPTLLRGARLNLKTYQPIHCGLVRSCT